MDIIDYAVSVIKNSIPREVLQLAYIGKPQYRAAPISLDEQISRQTIQGRVMRDINYIGGEEIVVDLTGVPTEQIDAYNYRMEIPASRLQNRFILTALAVNYMSYDSVVNNYGQGMMSSNPNLYSDVNNAVHRAMDSRSNIPIVSNSEVYAIDHRTLLIRNHLRTALVVQARLVVTNSERLENISVRSAPQFAKLCVYAAESFIWSNLVVKLDRGYLEAGQELGVIKSLVDEYKDAEENYQTYLNENWGAIAFMNSHLSHEKLLKLMVDPGM